MLAAVTPYLVDGIKIHVF